MHIPHLPYSVRSILHTCFIKYKFIIALFIAALFFHVSKAQVIFHGDKPLAALEKYRPFVIKAFEKNNNLQKNTVSINGMPGQTYYTLTHFRVFPLCKLNLRFPKTAENHVSDITVSEPSSLIIVTDNDSRVFEYEISNNSIGLLGENRSSRYKKVSQLNQNADLTFFYLLDNDHYFGNDVILFLDGKPVFVNIIDTRQFDDFDAFLAARFGSVSKFLALLKEEKRNKELTKASFEDFDVRKDAVTFVKKSTKFHYIFLPTDTSGNLACLMTDISQTIKVEDRQVSLLSKKIRERLIEKADPALSFDTLRKYPDRLKIYLNSLKNTPIINFIGKNIYPEICSILDKDQLEKYYYHTQIEELRFHRVDQYIYHICLNQTYPTLAAKSEAYKKYTLSILEDQ